MQTATVAVTIGPNGDDFYCAVAGRAQDSTSAYYSWISVSLVNPNIDLYSTAFEWDLDISEGIQGIAITVQKVYIAASSYNSGTS